MVWILVVTHYRMEALPVEDQEVEIQEEGNVEYPGHQDQNKFPLIYRNKQHIDQTEFFIQIQVSPIHDFSLFLRNRIWIRRLLEYMT